MIALGCDVKNVCAIHVTSSHVCLHFLHENLNQLKVSMIRCKMECSELLVCNLISPNLKSLLHGPVVFVLGEVKLASMSVN